MGRREIAWIGEYATPKAPDDDLLLTSAVQNDPENHIRLLEKYLAVAPYLLDVDERLVRSALWHTDLHSSNLFVDGEGHITAVIDWQESWAGPLMLQAKASPLVNYEGEILLKRPENFHTLDDEQKAQVKKQISKSTLLQLYLLEIKERNRGLAEVFDLDHGKTRRMPFEFVANTWDNDILPFREALINVERHWEELYANKSCPIHFSEAELRNHSQDTEGWNDVQDFFDHIDPLVKRDGWTHIETYDEARAIFAKLREVGLSDMKGDERESFERETRWASR